LSCLFQCTDFWLVSFDSVFSRQLVNFLFFYSVLWIWRATHIKKAARRELKRAQEVQRNTGARVFECGTFVAKGDKKKYTKKLRH